MASAAAPPALPAPGLCLIGARGQLGQEFRKLLPAACLLALDHAEVDVTAPARLAARLAGGRFDAIVDLAAYHDVDGSERDGARAFAVNAIGAGNVATIARDLGRTVVFLSSDYVFGGDRDRRTPYRESDPPAPLNVYGASKLAGEHLVRAATDDHLIIRTSSLFGRVTSRKGWTFPAAMLARARTGERLRVVSDQVMAPTYTADLARRIVALVAAGRRGTYHLTNTGETSWYGFARAVLAAVGLESAVEPVTTTERPTAARRPAYSVLSSERLPGDGEAMRPWPEALAAYLEEMGEL